jgi:hypothetical protein
MCGGDWHLDVVLSGRSRRTLLATVGCARCRMLTREGNKSRLIRSLLRDVEKLASRHLDNI